MLFGYQVLDLIKNEAPSDVNKLLDGCTVLIPDEKCLILLIKKYFRIYAAGDHLGPVVPPRTDGAY